MFTKKKTSELGDQENLMCSISPKLHNQQKKQLNYYTPENVNN